MPGVVDRARRGRDVLRLTRTARRVRARHLTYLSPQRLHLLERCAREVEARGVAGDVVEAGVALGGSAILLASLMGPDRRFHGYDVFGMIPPPGEHDPAESHERYEVIAAGRSEGIAGDDYYGYVPDLYERVAESFAEFDLTVDGDRVSLHRGPFEDTLHREGAVALAHIDCDWYDPVRTCLERLLPRLSVGGFIVLDDYFDYGGCRQAVDEVLAAGNGVRMVARPANVALARVA
jgi:O-methyltransferase